MSKIAKTRAVVFIDGSNFYHCTKARLGASTRGLNFAAFCQKLVMGRKLTDIRYYVGQVDSNYSRAYAAQQKFLSGLKKQGVYLRLGRIEPRAAETELCGTVRAWIEKNQAGDAPISDCARGELENICQLSKKKVWREKGVDMMCGIDMIGMAHRDEYDLAYLLSGDGDFAPAVEMVRKELRKEVFVCSPQPAYYLGQTADKFIPLEEQNFADCWL